MKDLNGVVGRSAAGIRVARYDAWESQASKVQTEFVVVILAQQLAVHFRHAVNSLRPLDGQIGRRIAWRFRSEGSNCRRNENAQSVLFGQLHDVVQSFSNLKRCQIGLLCTKL